MNTRKLSFLENFKSEIRKSCRKLRVKALNFFLCKLDTSLMDTFHRFG